MPIEGHDPEAELDIVSKKGTMIAKMHLDTGYVYVFIPPELADNEVVFEDQHGNRLEKWDPVELDKGERAELDGVVCYKFMLDSDANVDESMAFTRKLYRIMELLGQ